MQPHRMVKKHGAATIFEGPCMKVRPKAHTAYLRHIHYFNPI
jgi:hypothetical protein